MRFLRTILFGAVMACCGCEEPVAATDPAAADRTSGAPAAGGPSVPGLSNCCSKEEAGATVPGTSVYQLESTWQDQSGAERQLVSFRGRPVVMAMIFTTCEYACPRIMSDLKRIEEALGEGREKVRFVLVSFDAEHDQPRVLAEYAKTQDLDLARWTLLHGAEADVRELAGALGIKFKKSTAVGFSHSNAISLLDVDGRITLQLQGLGVEPAELLAALREPGK